MSSLAAKAQKQIEELRKKEDGLTGVPTGFTELDRLTSGFQRSDLIIVAARPGMGKTAMTLSLTRTRLPGAPSPKFTNKAPANHLSANG